MSIIDLLLNGLGTFKFRGVPINHEKFASKGARVVMANRNEAAVQETVKRIQARGGVASFRRTDVTQEDEIQALIDYTVAEFFGGCTSPLIMRARRAPRLPS